MLRQHQYYYFREPLVDAVQYRRVPQWRYHPLLRWLQQAMVEPPLACLCIYKPSEDTDEVSISSQIWPFRLILCVLPSFLFDFSQLTFLFFVFPQHSNFIPKFDTVSFVFLCLSLFQFELPGIFFSLVIQIPTTMIEIAVQQRFTCRWIRLLLACL